MASRKIYHAKPNYIYPTSEIITSDNPTILLASDVEFEETDIGNNSNHVNTVPLMETKRAMPISRQPKKTIRKNDNMGDKITPAASTSLPVSIPDWSKILKGDFKEHRKKDSDEDHVDVEDEHHEAGNMIPPHEYLARTRGASFSVHEGIGRTLKGSDLRRVRNAILKKVGFED